MSDIGNWVKTIGVECCGGLCLVKKCLGMLFEEVEGFFRHTTDKFS